MKKKLFDYLSKIDKILADESEKDLDSTIKNHLIMISFFQHERLVHLIVTAIFAICEVICICFTLFFLRLIVLDLAIMVLLVPYIYHYYKLENGVQKMYEQYDKLLIKNDISI